MTTWRAALVAAQVLWGCGSVAVSAPVAHRDQGLPKQPETLTAQGPTVRFPEPWSARSVSLDGRRWATVGSEVTIVDSQTGQLLQYLGPQPFEHGKWSVYRNEGSLRKQRVALWRMGFSLDGAQLVLVGCEELALYALAQGTMRRVTWSSECREPGALGWRGSDVVWMDTGVPLIAGGEQVARGDDNNVVPIPMAQRVDETTRSDSNWPSAPISVLASDGSAGKAALATAEAIHEFDFAGTRYQRLAHHSDTPLTGLVPSGSGWIFGTKQRTLYRIEPESGVVWRQESRYAGLRLESPSAEARWFLVTTAWPSAELRSVEDGHPIAALPKLDDDQCVALGNGRLVYLPHDELGTLTPLVESTVVTDEGGFTPVVRKGPVLQEGCQRLLGSRDHARLLFVDNNNAVQLLREQTTEQLRPTEPVAELDDVALSPDGRWAAVVAAVNTPGGVATKPTLWLWSLDEEPAKLRYAKPIALSAEVKLSFVSSRGELAVVSREGRGLLIDAPTGHVLQSFGLTQKGQGAFIVDAQGPSHLFGKAREVARCCRGAQCHELEACAERLTLHEATR